MGQAWGSIQHYLALGICFPLFRPKPNGLKGKLLQLASKFSPIAFLEIVFCLFCSGFCRRQCNFSAFLHS